MKIIVDVPSLSCARCATEIAVRPQVLYPNTAIDSAYAAPLSEMFRIRPAAEIEAVDDGGQSWRAILAERPVGWIAVPTGAKGVLCPSCVAAWLDAAKTFMAMPLPQPEEAVDVSSTAEARTTDSQKMYTPVGIGSTVTHSTRNSPAKALMIPSTPPASPSDDTISVVEVPSEESVDNEPVQQKTDTPVGIGSTVIHSTRNRPE